MKRERLLIYPYTKENLSLIQYIVLHMNQYEVSSVVSPNGWGLVGKDVGEVVYREKMNLIVESDYDASLKKCDTVLFCDYDNEGLNIKQVIFKMEVAIQNGKNIISFIELSEDVIEELEQKSKKYGVKIYSYSNKYKFQIEKNEIKNIALSDIESAVIFVMGISENTRKFELQLSLKEHFIKDGYNVLSISSRNYGDFFGMTPIPDFMFQTKYTEDEKIVLFNQFVKKQERKQKPDVIIIGVPGGIIPISKKFHNRFGMMAYEIAQAVSPDTTVLCTHFNYFDKMYFENISPTMKYKYNAEPDCFLVNNTVVDFINDDIQGDLSFIEVDFSKVEAVIKQAYNKDTFIYCDDIYYKIKNTLEEYAQVDSI